VPTREQVRKLLDSGLDYEAVGRRLGIAAGQAYMIATGVPADGSDTIPGREATQRRGLLPSSQHLVNPPHENPTGKESVRAWIAASVAADAPMRAARQRHTAKPAETSDPEDTHDAVTVLVRQHNQVNVLLKELQALPSHTTGGTPAQTTARKSIVDMITVRLAGHETIEEERLWPAVRAALPDGAELADVALQQEQEGKDTLTSLGSLDPDSREFDELVERLVLQLRKHVAFEEKVFLRMRDEVKPEDLDKLGRKLLSAGKRAPTRPHRHAPQRPGAAVTAAAAGAAVADSARDAVGDRPAKHEGKAH
jgi:hypothetical protein